MGPGYRRYPHPVKGDGICAQLPLRPGPSAVRQQWAYLLAREILQADSIHFLVGQSINEFYQNPLLPSNISIRRSLVEELVSVLRRYQKEVTVEYC